MSKINIGRKLIYLANAVAHGVRPKRYSCKFMKEGLTNYPDKDGSDKTWLLPRAVMDQMQDSFIGCPVIAKHDVNSTAEDFQKKVEGGEYDGIVSRCWTDKDGWDWAEFMVWNPEVIEKIEGGGWTVSCAYTTEDYKDGGTYNAVPYQHEVTKATYIHMAIVDNPRQTGAEIMLNSVDTEKVKAIIFHMNGKEFKLWPKGKPMVNDNESVAPEGWEDVVLALKKQPGVENPFATAWAMKKKGFEHSNGEREEQILAKYREFKKNEEEKTMTPEEKKIADEKAAKEAEDKKNEDKKNEAAEIDAEKAVIETPKGNVPLKNLISAWEEAEAAKSKASEDEEKKTLTMEDEIEVNGKRVKVSEMVDAYNRKAKQSEDEETPEEKEKRLGEEKETEAKKNADEAEAKKNEDRRAALKSEGKSDEEIEELMKHESEDESEDKKNEDEDKLNMKNALDDLKKNFNVLANAFSKSAVPVAKPEEYVTRNEKIAAVKESKLY